MKKYKEPFAMRQIHAIRENIYKELKYMTLQGLINYFNNGAKMLLKDKKNRIIRAFPVNK